MCVYYGTEGVRNKEERITLLDLELACRCRTGQSVCEAAAAHTDPAAGGLQNRWELIRFDRLPVKLVRTGSGLVRYETGQNSKFKFELKKMKNSQKKFLKILQGATNLMVSNFLQNSLI